MRALTNALLIVSAVGYGSVAFAQNTLTSASGLSTMESMKAASGNGAVGLSSGAMGTGLKVGDDSILHAGLGVSVGYDSNVYFQPNTPKTSPVMFVSPSLELTNAERDGTRPSGVYYDLSASVSYREYLSSNLEKYRAINPSVGGTVEFSSGQKLSLALSDQFSRIQLSPLNAGQATEQINLDLNSASVGFKFAPGGGRLRGLLRYTNLLSIYEGTASTSSNMGNELVLDIGWNWFPRTALYAQISQGLISYLDSASTRSSSYPLRAVAGIRGLLTEKLALSLGVGYANAFYTSGANPSGLGNLALVAELRYIISLLSQAGFGYRHDFVDSPFIGQFYNVDAIYGMYRQLIAARLVTYLFARYENRRFGGIAPLSRTDNLLSASASINYYLRTYLYAGLSYTMISNNTNLDSDDPRVFGTANASLGGVDYLKHQILFNLGVVY